MLVMIDDVQFESKEKFFGYISKALGCDEPDKIDSVAELFDVSRQAAKVRLMDLGYSKAEGVYPFVDGQYVRGYSFEAGALDKNQTFTIPYADLFKAYCFDREFKKLIDSGQFVFADRHLVLNNLNHYIV